MLESTLVSDPASARPSFAESLLAGRWESTLTGFWPRPLPHPIALAMRETSSSAVVVADRPEIREEHSNRSSNEPQLSLKWRSAEKLPGGSFRRVGAVSVSHGG